MPHPLQPHRKEQGINPWFDRTRLPPLPAQENTARLPLVRRLIPPDQESARKENAIATAAVLALPTRLNPLTLWHLLSLDAPTVAVVWLCFASRVTRTPLPPALPLAMFLAVWLLYAADRLLDAHPLPASVLQVPARPHRADPGVTHSHLQPRHRFHRTHRLPFAFAILIAVSALAILVPALPESLLRPYLVLAALLALWFALIHFTTLSLPKEFAPGLFFAAAVFLPIPHYLTPAILFAALCTLNCLYIHHWEHPTSRELHPNDSLAIVRVSVVSRPIAPVRRPAASVPRPAAPAHLHAAANPHPATRLALHHLPELTLALALLALAAPLPVAIPISISAFSLLTLNHYRHNLPPTALRAAADLALLTPLLVLPFLA